MATVEYRIPLPVAVCNQNVDGAHVSVNVGMMNSMRGDEDGDKKKKVCEHRGQHAGPFKQAPGWIVRAVGMENLRTSDLWPPQHYVRQPQTWCQWRGIGTKVGHNVPKARHRTSNGIEWAGWQGLRDICLSAWAGWRLRTMALLFGAFRTWDTWFLFSLSIFHCPGCKYINFLIAPHSLGCLFLPANNVFTLWSYTMKLYH